MGLLSPPPYPVLKLRTEPDLHLFELHNDEQIFIFDVELSFITHLWLPWLIDKIIHLLNWLPPSSSDLGKKVRLPDILEHQHQHQHRHHLNKHCTISISLGTIWTSLGTIWIGIGTISISIGIISISISTIWTRNNSLKHCQSPARSSLRSFHSLNPSFKYKYWIKPIHKNWFQHSCDVSIMWYTPWNSEDQVPPSSLDQLHSVVDISRNLRGVLMTKMMIVIPATMMAMAMVMSFPFIALEFLLVYL